jgi:anti-sigma factor RsiW
MPDLDRVIAGLRCRDLLSLVTDYVDGDLNDEEVVRVDAHLRGCVHCGKFGGEYGALVGELKSHFKAPPVNADVRARLANRMEAVWTSESE